MMNKKIVAEIFSSCFHPLIFFVVMPFIVIYYYTADSMYALKWGVFSLFFIGIATLFLFFQRLRGVFSDFDISKRKERFKFYSILLICGLIYTGIAFYFKGIFFPLSFISLGIGIGILVFDFFNKFIKASNHSAIACAFVLTIGLLYGAGAFLAISWIVIAVWWSRLILKKHTVSELVAGGVLGTLITLSTFFVGKSL